LKKLNIALITEDDYDDDGHNMGYFNFGL